jgi:WD40 repeat protein
LEFFDTIHDSPSQIYHFALLFCPSSSWLHKSYTTELSQGVKVVKGLPAGWGSCSRTVTLDDFPLALGCWKDTIAVGSQSGDIITLDATTGSQVAVLSGHTEVVTSVTFSSDGRSLVSGSYDKTLKLWDVQTGGVVKTFQHHFSWVLSVSISINCITIASGSHDNTICLWDVHTGECQCTIKQHSPVACVSFSPANPQHLISVSGGVVQQWDISGHQVGPTYKGSHAAFSLDGTHLVLCGEKVTTVQNSDSGEIVAKFPTGSNPKCCCLSPNGRLVAIAAGTTAYIWDTTGSDPHLIKTFIGHTSDITSLTFSSSSSLISASSESVKFWQLDASLSNQITSNPESTPPDSDSIESVSLQAESGIVISSDLNGMVKIWDISTGLCRESFKTQAEGRFWRDAQIIDGRLVVVWFKDRGICVWDSKRSEPLQMTEVDQHEAKDIRISGDGSKVFLLIGKSIQAWSIETGDVVGDVELGDGAYLDPLCMGGSRICVCFPSSLIQGWDFGVSGSSPIPLSSTPPERSHLDFVGGDYQLFEGPLWVKDTVTGKKVLQLSGRYARPYDVQWDGQYLVAGYGSGEMLILDFIQTLPQ